MFILLLTLSTLIATDLCSVLWPKRQRVDDELQRVCWLFPQQVCQQPTQQLVQGVLCLFMVNNNNWQQQQDQSISLDQQIAHGS